jgi:thioredoxin reductase (NADPH)
VRAECRAGAVVVATGYFDSPNLLGVPGEGLEKVAHSLPGGTRTFTTRIACVVGGGNSAVDAALELHRWGARVTIVHFEPASTRT